MEHVAKQSLIQIALTSTHLSCTNCDAVSSLFTSTGYLQLLGAPSSYVGTAMGT